MRKALIFLALLLALSIGGTVCLSNAAYAARDQIAVTATHHYGDVSALEGAELLLHANYEHRLFWDVAYDFTAQSVDTQYRYEPRRVYEVGESNYYGVSMYAEAVYLLDYYEEETEELGKWERMTREAVEATPNGTEMSHIFRLADYADFYEWTLSVDLPYPISHSDPYDTYWLTDVELKVANDLREFFKIPVLENEYVEISVGKDEAGNIISMGSGSGVNPAPLDNINSGDWYSPWQNNAVTDEACFFLFEGTSTNGVPMDFSHVPGGYGIYRLPYEEPTYGEYGDMVDTGIRSEQLEMVYALPQDIRVVHFVPSNDGSRLLLFTQENEECILTVIDTSTFETLQRFAVCDYPEEGWIWIHEEEDFFVAVAEDGTTNCLYTLILPDESGDYRIEFSVGASLGRFPEESMEHDVYMAYDGERLLRVALLYEYGQYYLESCAFSAAVYDETGLLYCGVYQTGLTDSVDSAQNNYAIVPAFYKPVELSW